jgi:hypothetical protein
MDRRTIALIGAISLACCRSMDLPRALRQGTIIAPDKNGLNGYQHGIDGSLLSVGAHVKRVVQHGYFKVIGDEGVLAIRMTNGSAFGIPNANARSLRSTYYGALPKDHDAFVKAYFIRLGIPTDQVAAVRTMTMLEASGRSDETTRTKPVVSAYYTVLDRAVDGILVPDSFAWARVNAEGRVVAEAVYWPALPGEVVSGARRLKDVISDPARRIAIESHIPGPKREGGGGVVIRHASAWVDSSFEAFACLDVVVLSRAIPGNNADEKRGGGYATADRSPAGMITVRHVDAGGTERFLPQERRNMGSQTGQHEHNHGTYLKSEH